MKKLFSFQVPRERELMTQKGVYPYGYMNSFDRFQEKVLPQRKKKQTNCPKSSQNILKLT